MTLTPIEWVIVAIGIMVNAVCLIVDTFVQAGDVYTTTRNLVEGAQYGVIETNSMYKTAWGSGKFWSLIQLKIISQGWVFLLCPVPFIGILLMIPTYETWKAVKGNEEIWKKIILPHVVKKPG